MSDKKPKPGNVFIEVSKNQSGGLSLIIGDESTGHRLAGGKVGGCETVAVFEVDAEELIREAKTYAATGE